MPLPLDVAHTEKLASGFYATVEVRVSPSLITGKADLRNDSLFGYGAAWSILLLDGNDAVIWTSDPQWKLVNAAVPNLKSLLTWRKGDAQTASELIKIDFPSELSDNVQGATIAIVRYEKGVEVTLRGFLEKARQEVAASKDVLRLLKEIFAS